MRTIQKRIVFSENTAHSSPTQKTSQVWQNPCCLFPQCVFIVHQLQHGPLVATHGILTTSKEGYNQSYPCIRSLICRVCFTPLIFITYNWQGAHFVYKQSLSTHVFQLSLHHAAGAWRYLCFSIGSEFRCQRGSGPIHRSGDGPTWGGMLQGIIYLKGNSVRTILF